MPWQCELVHRQHPWRDLTIDVFAGADGELPPGAVRRPTTFVGMRAWDVYLLSDGAAWPASAAYTFTETVTNREEVPAELLPSTIDLDR